MSAAPTAHPAQSPLGPREPDGRPHPQGAAPAAEVTGVADRPDPEEVPVRPAAQVTVVVIVHNDAARLPRAVESVRRQSCRDLEIVVSDDHSTDATPEVARRLAARDERITYLRLPANSGGCSAPRNLALDSTSAPYVMFLDSDDELPPDAVELLLAAHRERPVDFTMGAVSRVRADTGSSTRWMPHLVAERRTVEGIDSEPGLLFEHLSTSKMYARSFLDAHALRFPEGIHYEDQLFSAQAYCLARAFTVIPQTVYRWYVEPHAAAGGASISNQRDRLENVRDRVHVQRLIDDFLLASGHEGLRPHKDYKFLKHDFRIYAGDFPHRDARWLAGFADLVVPYLDTLDAGAYERLPRAERIVARLVRDRRLPEAQLAARGLGQRIGPREVVTDEAGGLYWGGTPPRTEADRRELDLSEEGADTAPFPAVWFRHEVTELRPGPGTRMDLTVRTYDPLRRLPVGPQLARLVLVPGGLRHAVPFRLDPVGPGVYEGRVRLDPAAARLPVRGFDGVRYPVLELARGRLRNSGPLLGPLGFAPATARVAAHGGALAHEVDVGPEGGGAGRIRVRWRRAGLAGRVRPLLRGRTGAGLRRAARLAAGVLR